MFTERKQRGKESFEITVHDAIRVGKFHVGNFLLQHVYGSDKELMIFFWGDIFWLLCLKTGLRVAAAMYVYITNAK